MKKLIPELSMVVPLALLLSLILTVSFFSCSKLNLGNIVREHIEAVNNDDVEKNLPLFTDDAVFEIAVPEQYRQFYGKFTGKDQLRNLMEWDVVNNARLTINDMKVEGDTVIVKLTEKNEGWRLLGIEELPFTATYQFRGRLLEKVKFEFSPENAELLDEKFKPFAEWVSKEHLREFSKMATAGYSAENCRLYLSLLQEWRDSQDTCYTSIKYGDNSKEGRFAKVNGIKMYYEIYGDPTKQPLLLIHGNGGSIFSERCQIEYFRNQYRVIVADSRFHGKTENGSELLTYDLMARDYDSLLDYLKIGSAYIVGQSDGGIVGLIMAINYPKKVKKLVTTAPNLRPDSTALPTWAIDLTRNDLKEIETKMSKGDTSKELLRQWATLNLMDKYPNITDNELSKIKAEVLVMAADADEIKLEHILEIYQNIPKAQLFIMPGATHFMLRSEYALFNQIVERFLNNPFKRPTTKEILLK